MTAGEPKARWSGIMLISVIATSACVSAAEKHLPPRQLDSEIDPSGTASALVDKNLSGHADERIGKQALAQGILIAAYRNSFNIGPLTQTESTATKRRLINKVLAEELSKLLAEIEKSGATIPIANQSRVTNITQAKIPATLDTLVAKLEPNSPTPTIKQSPLKEGKKFPWPVSGDVSSAPGSALRKGGAKWPGILINAEPGAKVLSIAPGKVVYAGEMKNLGMLVIVNHEDGHLSLYGKNAQLFVAQGDRVRKNQTIAIIETNPIASEVGLYFEIRRNGQPIDPRLLCTNTLDLKP